MKIPILRFLFRKMWNTRWLTLSTLAGLIVAVSFTISIPMYADGALKRVVSASLAEENDGYPAGSLLIRYQAVGDERADLDSVNEIHKYIEHNIPQKIGFPHNVFVRAMSIRSAQLIPVDPSKVDPSRRRQMTVMTYSGLSDKAEISGGRIFANEVKNGVIEAVVLQETLYRNDIQIGDEFTYPIRGGLGIAPLTVKVVGTYEPKDSEDPYWYQGTDGLINSFIISEEVFQKALLEERSIPLNFANWFYVFDLREIKVSQLSPLSNTLERLDIELYQILKDTRVDISFLPMLGEFKKQSIQLQTLLFTLAAPMIAMVFYFIALNAKQSLERQRSDIAVLRSRGGSTRQIFRIYLFEGLILGGAALIAGPYLGWFMAKTIGSSSGFLTFVNRESIPVGISYQTMLYGAAAVGIAITAALIPAMTYAKASIVNVKQQMARADRRPLWQKWFLDIALIGLCAYGWYAFNERQFLSLRTGLTTDQLQVQPMLFFVPALTIFALGLFFLRIFPWLLRFFNWLGKTFLPVPLYLTLTQLSRSAKSYYPLMLLLILTIGLGVYNSSAARTIDLNSTERTLYQYGADVVIQTVWEGIPQGYEQPPEPPGQGGENPGSGSGGGTGQPGGPGGGSGGGNGQPPGGGTGYVPPQQMLYVEPPFEVYKTLEGVQYAARVLTTKGNAVVSGRSAGTGMLMAIDNVDFARVGWFREDLYPIHQHYYLDFLGEYEQAVLVSNNFAQKYQLKAGDLVSVVIQQQAIEFVIVGVLPYWPSLYPDEMPFFIANLDYIYDQIPLIPYEVWLKLEDSAKVLPIFESLKEKNLEVSSYKILKNELISQKRHPARGGVFGILSLGFLVSVTVSLTGYIL
jgi:putative ABC transport system permease protein